MPDWCLIARPTAVEPVNVMNRTRGSAVSARPTVSPGPLTTFRYPGGRPASRRITARASEDSGVSSAGFSTTALPAARAGPILCATVFSGALNGAIAATTPTGTRIVNARRCSLPGLAATGTSSPAMRVASSADRRRVPTARASSVSASVRVKPVSAM